MLINDIVVFKTPLDREYKNVYDAKNFTEYENLISTFPKLVIQNVVERDRKSFGDNLYNFQITVEGYTLSTLKDYNYCAVRIQHSVNNSSWKYYFITDIREITSVPTADTQYGYTEGSILRLTLQYDVWANNIPNFANKERYEYCPRRTTKNIVYNNETHAQSIIEGYKETVASNVKSITRLFSGVLFLALRYGEANFYQQPRNSSKLLISNIPSQSSAPIVYIPIYYDPEVYRNAQYFRTAYPIDASTYQQYNWRLQNNWDSLQIPPYDTTQFNFWGALQHTSLLEAFVTWYGPTPIKDGNGYIWNSMGFLETDVGGFVPVLTQSQSFMGSQEYSFNITDTQGFNLNLSNISGYNNLKNSSDYLNTYPYKHTYSIFTNGIEIPLIPTHDKYTFKINLDKSNSASPRLKITLNNNQYLTKVLTDKYNVISSVDSLQQYLRNSGSQYAIAKGQAILASATSVANFAVNPTISGGGGTANSILNVIKQNAKLKDVDRQLDTFAVPSTIGTDNIYVDGIYLVEREVIDEDLLQEAWYDYQYYGSYYEKYDNIFANYRHTFDYVQTTNCNLPFIQNPYERKILENIFDSGITKWHILPATDTIGTSKTFDKTINNYPEVTLG